MGYQSRPFAYRAPAGIVRVGGVDCSCWNRCYDPPCQEALYTAFFEHFFADRAAGPPLPVGHTLTRARAHAKHAPTHAMQPNT